MNSEHIHAAITKLTQSLADNPEKALVTDKPAVATVQSGLACRVEGPSGAVLFTDMPLGVGGGASAPSPGWFLRAALASCDATVIAMRAAQVGVALSKLEVTADSTSDSRGILGVGEGVRPGPLEMRVRVSIAAEGASAEQLRAIVEWAEAHSPVGDAVRRAITTSLTIDA